MSAGNKTEVKNVTQRAPILNVQKWHIAFVMNCNLRCTYCITHHGRFAGPAQLMSGELQNKFLEILANTAQPVSLEFGTGETFLAYDSFIQFVDAFKAARPEYTEADTISVTTNGSLLDEEKIDALANRGIILVFSIDGDAATHERQRPSASGESFHRKILSNYRYYRNLLKERNISQKTTVISILTPDNSLRDVEKFWADEGVSLYTTALALPRIYDDEQLEKYAALQEQYLKDLKEIAFEKAEHYGNPGFLDGFRGPLELLEGWRNILLDQKGGFCSLLTSFYALNSFGDIYPCELLMNKPEFLVGNLNGGINPVKFAQAAEKIEAFERQEKEKLQAGVCTAACFVELYSLLQSKAGRKCSSFVRQVHDVLYQSYEHLSS